MADHLLSRKERILSAVGVAAILISCAAFSLILMTELWFSAAIFVAVGFLALGVLFLIVGRSQSPRSGAPTNTQLKQTPPAIIRGSNDDGS